MREKRANLSLSIVNCLVIFALLQANKQTDDAPIEPNFARGVYLSIVSVNKPRCYTMFIEHLLDTVLFLPSNNISVIEEVYLLQIARREFFLGKSSIQYSNFNKFMLKWCKYDIKPKPEAM